MSSYSMDDIRERFHRFLAGQKNWKQIPVTVNPLNPAEAIGQPEHTDYPLFRGKEVLIQSTVLSGIGQAFTNDPTVFEGTLEDVIKLGAAGNRERGIYFATMNAVLNHFGQAGRTVHCRDDEPGKCGLEIGRMIKERYGFVPVGIVGYQPGIIAGCAGEIGADLVRVTDMNRDNLGMSRFGVEVWDGISRTGDLIRQSEVLLVTGTTFINGTAFELLERSAGKPFYFYGTTAAGVAELMGFKRHCSYSTP